MIAIAVNNKYMEMNIAGGMCGLYGADGNRKATAGGNNWNKNTKHANIIVAFSFLANKNG